MAPRVSPANLTPPCWLLPQVRVTLRCSADVDAGSRWPAGGAVSAPGVVPAPPPARTVAALRDVMLGYKERGARFSGCWRSSRTRVVGAVGAARTRVRGSLSDVLLRAPHRGRPQGDRHAGGGVAAAAAPDEASRAVHPQGLGRPTAPGRPQEAGLVQGHGEPRDRARLGIPSRRPPGASP